MPHEQLCLYSDVNVDLTWTLIEQCECASGLVHPTQSIPDHNVLIWSFNVSSSMNIPLPFTDKSFTASYVKYDVSYVPNQFLSDPISFE